MLQFLASSSAVSLIQSLCRSIVAVSQVDHVRAYVSRFISLEHRVSKIS